MEPQLRLSVHQLVDFLLRNGDIDNRIFNRASMSEGTRIHAYYQKKQGNTYISEYHLEETFVVDEFQVTLEGRADGIIVLPYKVIIDEIKSTVADLDEFYQEQGDWHLGQAECYALMYAHENDLSEIDVRLTYISQVTETQKVYNFHYQVTELEDRVISLISDYLDFYQILFRKKILRNSSCRHLEFPFPTFRAGQRQLAKYCYGVASKGGRLFVEAPTGIGKTISTLYPFVHSFSQEKNDKIFYLTAKTSGREAAATAIQILKNHGLQCISITITAKDKICFQTGSSCNPDECPFTKNYYGKIQRIIKESLLTYDDFDEKTIIEIASQNEICPFELQLDLSLYADIILCDYNYAFDPMVYMRRYFDEDSSSFIALIDEAHNLLERGRDMYSAELDSETFAKMKKEVAKIDHKKLKSAIRKIQKTWKELKSMCAENETIILPNCDMKALKGLNDFLKAGQDVLKNQHEAIDDAFLDFYFAVNRFLKLYELFDDSFSLYLAKQKKVLILKMLCLDPSRQLRKRLLQFRATVLFSATLSPDEYYIDVLGGKEEDPFLRLGSPFAKENLLLMVQPNVSTRFKNRLTTIQDITSSILTFIKHRVGNYFVFFPSYAYLKSIHDELIKEEMDVEIIAQNRDMTEKEKNLFLKSFINNPSRTHLGLVVLGGAFSEGIDLIGDRLIGAIIVGVGLPTISFERDLIKDYYQKKNGQGYLYSYVNPGMNRVMQAVGRVIRSEQDRGMVLLIDDRYLTWTYQDLFKNEWRHYEVITTNEEMDTLIAEFWKN